MIKINLLSYNFNDIVLTLFGGIFFTSLWNLYYVHTNTITTPLVAATDFNLKKTTKLSGGIYKIIYALIVFWFFITNFIFVYNFTTTTIFWDTLQLSNNTINFLFLSTCVLLLIICSATTLSKQNLSFNVEYVLFIFLITISSYLLISSTNLFVAIFFLEFIALLIFGKFAVSKVWFKANLTNKTTNQYVNQYSYGLFNSLFFQFWANFVSSVFLFFSLVNLHYICGISNFFLLNFIFSFIGSSHYIIYSFNFLISAILLTGLFIKLGIAPYQFFKIETYKGIPLFMVVVYTTLYLMIYIYFFIYLLTYQLPTLRNFSGSYILVLITVSLLYLLSLLFDTKNFKAFLSYSTLVTIMNLFIVILIV